MFGAKSKKVNLVLLTYYQMSSSIVECSVSLWKCFLMLIRWDVEQWTCLNFVVADDSAIVSLDFRSHY